MTLGDSMQQCQQQNVEITAPRLKRSCTLQCVHKETSSTMAKMQGACRAINSKTIQAPDACKRMLSAEVAISGFGYSL